MIRKWESATSPNNPTIDTAAAGSQIDLITEHNLSMNELENAMRTNFATGLTSDEAASRLLINGPNAINPNPNNFTRWFSTLQVENPKL